MLKKLHVFILSLLVVIGVSACTNNQTSTPPVVEPSPLVTEQVTQFPTAQIQVDSQPKPVESPFPPFVYQTTLERGHLQGLSTPIEITFDQPMDRASVETAFRLLNPSTDGDQPVKGTFDWVDDLTVRFTPAQPYQRSQQYEVVIDASAINKSGLPLNRPVSLLFDTVGTVEVTDVQPADKALEIDTNTSITVAFNRAIVPLQAIEDRKPDTELLIFDPPVQGTGEWINTSVYRFTPASQLVADKKYTITIAQGLTSINGSLLQSDFSWSFTTAFPAVVAVYPADGDIFVQPTPVISVAFSQMMDHTSIEAGYNLQNQITGEVVSGSFAWVDKGFAMPPDPNEFMYYDPIYNPAPEPVILGVQTLVFTPDKPLNLQTRYLLTINGKTLNSLIEMAQPYNSSFTTVPDLAIQETTPANGDRKVLYPGGLQITFTAPVDAGSIKLNQTIFISPPVSSTNVFTSIWENDTIFGLYFPSDEFNASYTVTLGSAIKSRYGQSLGKDTTIQWTNAPKQPFVYLTSAGFISTYTTFTDTLAYITVAGIQLVDFGLYHLSETDFMNLQGQNEWDARQNYQPHPSDLIRSWQVKTAVPQNHAYVYKTNLASDQAGILEPGLYYLQITVDPANIDPDLRDMVSVEPIKQVIVVSDYNITIKNGVDQALAWLTDLRTGQPVAGSELRFLTEDALLGSASTDVNGVALINYDRLENSYGPPRFVFSKSPFAVVSSQWVLGIETWQFNNINIEDNIYQYAGYLYTDRVIYRPGDTIYFKGILRKDDDAHYTLPPTDDPVSVIISDYMGNEIYRADHPLNGNGTFNGRFVLDKAAGLGNYNIRAEYKEYQDYQFSRDLQIAQYQKPEFTVDVSTDKPEYLANDTVQLTAHAEYFFGGPVSNATVRYNILAAPSFFEYKGEGYYEFTDYEDSYTHQDAPGFSFGELLTQGEGTTDDKGNFRVEIESNITQYLSSQLFTLEVIVVDPNSNKEVASRVDAIVHKGKFYVGLQPQQYVGVAGKENSVDVITVDWHSVPVSDKEVTVVFAKHTWYSAKVEDPDTGEFYWQNIVENTPVFTQTVTTNAEGQVVAGFVPKEGGIYKVIAVSTDDAGNTIRSSAYMWISDSKYINWRQENNDRITLVADKQQYNVGDTATILVTHPYSTPVMALVTQERGKVYDYQVVNLSTNSEQLQIPVTADMLPNVYVSVVIMGPPDTASITATGISTDTGYTVSPLPSFKVGYTKIPISAKTKEINLTLEAAPPIGSDTYRPGEEVIYKVKALDSDGNPVQAEFSLALVDKAVLALQTEDGPSILERFWRQRGLGINTATGLTMSAERLNLNTAPLAKGGGGGDFAKMDLRTNFQDTSFWLADFTTDASGQGEITVTLPDNLTTWVMLARGISLDDRTLVGDQKVEIIASKPLLVRSVLPRFLVIGDESHVKMIVQNNTDKTLTAQTVFDWSGVEFVSGAGDSPTGEVLLKPGEITSLTYSIKATDAGQATFRFGVASGTYKDAVELTRPIYYPSTPETVATAGILEKDGRSVEGIALPRSFDPTQGTLSINLDPSLAAGLRDGLTYLEYFPYECTEQTVSRFLPNIVTYRAYQKLGLNNADLADHLPDLVSAGLQRLYSEQNMDGGWGWFAPGESNPFVTAYVVLGMVEAQDADFTVDNKILSNAIDFLKSKLIPPKDIEAPWQANQQAFALYVLARANQGDLGRTNALFDRREALDYYGRALLALTLATFDPADSRISTLIADLTDAVQLEATGAHWAERQRDYWGMNTDTRSTALIVTALSRLDPQNAILPNAVRWLVSVRQQNHWENTQETAWAIMGLTDWLLVSGELDANYSWIVNLNEANLGAGGVTPETVDQPTTLTVAVKDLLTDNINRLNIDRLPLQDGQAGKGRLYYTTYLEYYKPVETVSALDNGIYVEREYSLSPLDPAKPAEGPINEAQIGDMINVKLTVVAPNDLYYVLIEDPIPAGTEGVDSSLQITSVVGQSPTLTRTDPQPELLPGSEVEQAAKDWTWLSHSELRDDKAVLFAAFLPKGTYEYTYQLRAGVAGTYHVIPSHAKEMYFPETFGRSDAEIFIVR